jgi:hypothetical protein
MLPRLSQCPLLAGSGLKCTQSLSLSYKVDVSLGLFVPGGDGNSVENITVIVFLRYFVAQSHYE